MLNSYKILLAAYLYFRDSFALYGIYSRPTLKQLLCDIENGLEFYYMLVYKLSRFGRNAADIYFGVNLICIEVSKKIHYIG